MIYEGHCCRLGETIFPLEKQQVEIVCFHARTVHLMIRRQMDDPLRDALAQIPRAMLLYEDGSRLRAQRGLLHAIGEEDVIGFVAADRFIDGNRRVYSRAPLPLAVTVRTLDATGATVSDWSGTCSDVSAGGMRVADRGTIVAAARTEIVVLVPGLEPIGVSASVAWRNEQQTALITADTAEYVHGVGDLVARWHRQRAREARLRAQARAA